MHRENSSAQISMRLSASLFRFHRVDLLVGSLEQLHLAATGIYRSHLIQSVYLRLLSA
jgi:hypothetical protein